MLDSIYQLSYGIKISLKSHVIMDATCYGYHCIMLQKSVKQNEPKTDHGLQQSWHDI